MSGLGSSIFCKLPKEITAVLDAVDMTSKTPVGTRLAATIGPESNSVTILEQLLREGMKMARFDFTYGDVAFHAESYANLKVAMKNTGTLCGVMLNPPGPDLHVINRSPSQVINLQAGQQVALTNDASAQASTTVLPINWPGSFDGHGLAPGSSLFIGQYLFTGAETTSAYLTVQSVETTRVLCVVNNTCMLEGVQLTVKLPTGVRSPLPCLGPADEGLLAAWASLHQVEGGAADFVLLPHAHSAADVADCRAMIARVGLPTSTSVVSKLEDVEGLVAHKEIVESSDAVIFSRGNLGMALEPEKVFLAQKMLLRSANALGKPVFVTRVVDTMTDAPRPTRAEATDVANLVLDGADGVLLGSETFRGKYPVDAVRTVAAICRAAEAVFDNYAYYSSQMDEKGYFTLNPEMDRSEALASAAVRAAHKMDARLIVAFTVTGRTARLLAKYKPSQPILTVVCSDPSTAEFSNSAFSAPSASRQSTGGAQSAANLARVGSEPMATCGQLGSWTHGAPAKRCLLYRGAVPVMVDAPAGVEGGGILEAVLDYAKSVGLVQSGDRVVVSQCPRNITSDVMSEAGVVQLVTVDHKLD